MHGREEIVAYHPSVVEAADSNQTCLQAGIAYIVV